MNVEKLYAAVYANPRDDAPRSVLADALQEAGDPRGEFIALQLARGRDGKKTRREGQLLKAHGRKWLGAMAGCVPNKGMVFERGFLAKGVLNERQDVAEALFHHPEWATLEEIEVDRALWTDLSGLAKLPWLRALTTNGNAGQLSSHPGLEKIDVGFVFQTKDAEHLAKLALPALREFRSRNCHPPLAKLKRFLTQVEPSLRVLSLGVEDADAWIPWCAKAKLERAEIRTTMNPWRLRFEGDRITAVYERGGHPEPRASSHLAQRLALVPSPKAWHVTVMQAYSWQGTSFASIKRGTAAALKRFASYELVE